MTRAFGVAICLGLAMAGCSRSNNLLLGRVEATVGGHTVVVTDCYRFSVPPPTEGPTADGDKEYRFAPCRDAIVVVRSEQLTVNNTGYGKLQAGDTVTVDHGRVLVNEKAR